VVQRKRNRPRGLRLVAHRTGTQAIGMRSDRRVRTSHADDPRSFPLREATAEATASS
jgi:hypothetical protein